MTLVVLIAALVLLALSLPTPVVAFVFGALLPIDVFGGVSPASLDFARYSLAVALVVRSPKYSSARTSNFATATLVALMAIPTISIVRSVVEVEGPEARTSYIAILSALVAFSVAKRQHLHGQIVYGFAVGATASAVDIVLQAAGLPYLGSQAVPPFNRYAGFSFSSTTVSPFLAVGIIVLIASVGGQFLARENEAPSRRSTARTASIAVRSFAILALGAGLLLSGGRGGLAGLALALMIFAWSVRRRYPLVILLVTSALIGVSTVRYKVIADFLNRGGESASGFTTGRSQLDRVAWDAIASSGIWGPDPGVAAELRPHVVVLTFGVSSGVAGVIIGVGLVLMIAGVAASAASATPARYTLVAAVILTSSVLEPAGFFIGLSKTTLLMIVLISFDARRSAQPLMPEPRSQDSPHFDVGDRGRAP